MFYGFPTAGTRVNINDVDWGKVRLIKDVDIELSDGSSPVTPDAVSIVGNTVSIQVPAATAISTATLMQTGQTTSHKVGDDAYTNSEGRATDFFMLAENNPFGNTTRFTDELGGSTYTNNIVIDWSTYNGSTVLGYYRSTLTAALWAAQIDACLALSIGTFVTGWRLANRTEWNNMLNFENVVAPDPINYAPFNITFAANYWTSTTVPSTTANAYYLNIGVALVSQIDKTSISARGLAVRTFTVTGTTLT